MHPTFFELANADWDDVVSVGKWTDPVYDAFEDDDLLPRLLAGLRADDQLRPMCERSETLEKLVLYDDQHAKIRIRLHVLRAGHFDRPHNHRWTFASMIFAGSYVHELYGRDDLLADGADPGELTPILHRVEREGARYVLHHTSVHNVQTDADAISIVVRGPAAKDYYRMIDRVSGKSMRIYGSAGETQEQRENRKMTPAQLDETIERVLGLTGR